MVIIGISAFYHESAACLIRDGQLIAASAEERFSRKKHDSSFPKLALDFCLKEAKVNISQVDYLVFYEKPFWKFNRILLSSLATYPLSWRLFPKAMINFLLDKLWVRSILADQTKIDPRKILFVPHHLSHAAACFYPSGFKQAAVLTLDGVGEWTSTAYGVGQDKEIKLEEEIKFPHSLGLLYSVFTAFLGFEINDGEYKVMGMAPYGKPRYLNKIKKLVKVFPDGSIALNMDYFSFHYSDKCSYNQKFVQLFGPSRPRDLHFFTLTSGYPSYFGDKPKNYLKLCQENQRYADIAASLQVFLEETLLKLVNYLQQKTKLENLCIGGGVGLNSVANGYLLHKAPFKRIYVQPASGDDGGALGAALYVYHHLLQQNRNFIQDHCYYGQKFSGQEVEKLLKQKKIKYQKIASEDKLLEVLVSELTLGKVIGFFHGRAEWGPRALGSRSILADPRNQKMKEIINTKIKFREPYRPFAPVVLADKAADYFALDGLEHQSLTNFMLGVFPVRKEAKKIIPASTHVDGSARLQIISQKQNARYYNLIKKFGQKTGVYVLINTSFNLRGEPIVNSPEDALKTFAASGLDTLALENYLIYK